ncbi:hypothetical protein B2G88_18835 [Natronolimnobius baerhuensis]|uniref:DUF1028 domain-containing protein n=2 Tax=Natronolimnobius baerhuensis TaxID=253108 RepID=A0A202E3H5_9EURY|nr:hypothetical protein B2G88_18835 [Natronolimnobius baerhuensis]
MMADIDANTWQTGFAPGTFSIAATDPETSQTGVAVTTGTAGVGAVCPYVSDRAAVVTQSFTKTSHGANALEFVDRGIPLDAACEVLLDADEYASYRQLHGIQTDGTTFVHTGDDCVSWNGGCSQETHTVAGNMLAGEAVLDAVTEAFVDADGKLVDRLVTALEAGQEAGGDKRGKVSAALLVHAPVPQRYHNLRVDLSDDPVTDLRELLEHTKRVTDELPGRLAEQLGTYPEEMLDSEIKY